jgi:hypothetical protein
MAHEKARTASIFGQIFPFFPNAAMAQSWRTLYANQKPSFFISYKASLSLFVLGLAFTSLGQKGIEECEQNRADFVQLIEPLRQKNVAFVILPAWERCSLFKKFIINVLTV